MTRVVVHIDRLVLHDFGKDEGHRLSRRLQAVLAESIGRSDAVSAIVRNGDRRRLRFFVGCHGESADATLLSATIVNGLIDGAGR